MADNLRNWNLFALLLRRAGILAENGEGSPFSNQLSRLLDLCRGNIDVVHLRASFKQICRIGYLDTN